MIDQEIDVTDGVESDLKRVLDGNRHLSDGEPSPAASVLEGAYPVSVASSKQEDAVAKDRVFLLSKDVALLWRVWER